MYKGRKGHKSTATPTDDIEAIQVSKLAMIEKEFERVDMDLRLAQDYYKALWGYDKEDQTILPYLTQFEGVLRSIFIFHHEFIYVEGDVHGKLKKAFEKCEELRNKCYAHPHEELPYIMEHLTEPKDWWKELVTIYDELSRIHSKALGVMSMRRIEISKAKLITPDDWEETPDKVYEKPEEPVWEGKE